MTTMKRRFFPLCCEEQLEFEKIWAIIEIMRNKMERNIVSNLSAQIKFEFGIPTKKVQGKGLTKNEGNKNQTNDIQNFPPEIPKAASKKEQIVPEKKVLETAETTINDDECWSDEDGFNETLNKMEKESDESDNECWDKLDKGNIN